MNKVSNIPLCFDLITIDENIIVGNEFVRRFSQSLAFCPYKKRMREEKTLKITFLPDHGWCMSLRLSLTFRHNIRPSLLKLQYHMHPVETFVPFTYCNKISVVFTGIKKILTCSKNEISHLIKWYLNDIITVVRALKSHILIVA